jgi:hypothetical protein
MLGQRLNGLKLVVAPGAFPVGLEFGAVQLDPLGNERSRPPRQGTCDEVAVQIDRRRVPTVARMEARSGVMSLVPVHVDGDAVEEADPWHAMTVRAASVGSEHPDPGTLGEAGPLPSERWVVALKSG